MNRCLVQRRLEIRNDARASSCLGDWADGDAVRHLEGNILQGEIICPVLAM